MSRLDVQLGSADWSLEIPDDRLRMLSRSFPSIADPRKTVRDALEHPWKLDFPFRRALTPDDRIAMVVDEQLPQLGHLVAGVLEYLASAGIGPEAVTILTLPGSRESLWIDELPDDFADVHTEVHQPADRKLLSYLAATKTGHRIYLNRTLVDADQIISVSARRFDPILGYSGGAGSLYPGFSDADTRRTTGDRLTMEPPGRRSGKLREEIAEIAWLLGSPMFIQVIEGSGNGLETILAGLVNSDEEGIRLLEQRWHFETPEAVDVVYAVVSSGGRDLRFDALARAAAAASRIVKSDGAIVLLTDSEPILDEGMDQVRQAPDISSALKGIGDQKPADRSAVFQWLHAATHGRLYLASGLRPELVEDLFATPILSPSEIQRLVDAADSVVFLPDADKALVTLGS